MIDQLAACGCHASLNHRQVKLLDRSLTKCLHQAARRFGRRGEHHHATDGLVDAVDGLQENIARLVARLFQHRFRDAKGRFEAALRRMILVMLDKDPRRLFDHEAVVVLLRRVNFFFRDSVIVERPRHGKTQRTSLAMLNARYPFPLFEPSQLQYPIALYEFAVAVIVHALAELGTRVPPNVGLASLGTQ